jgi:hypothetical protein
LDNLKQDVRKARVKGLNLKPYNVPRKSLQVLDDVVEGNLSKFNSIIFMHTTPYKVKI